MRTANEICRMDAVSLAANIRSKQLSAVEVIDAVLARMDKLEPILHAFCTPTPDLARETAKKIDQEIMAACLWDRLLVCPSVSRILCAQKASGLVGLAGLRGFRARGGRRRRRRLKNAGAVILGKTRAGVRLQRRRPQPGVSDDTQSLEHRSHSRWLERGLRRGVAAWALRSVARRRIDPHSELLLGVAA